MKKRTQALGGVTLQEVPVSAAVLAAAEGQVTVRAFQIGASEEAPSLAEVMAAAHEQAGVDPSLPWELGPERDHEETHAALKYMNALLPTIEAEVGTAEEYRSGSYYWFQMTGPDFCNHGERTGLYLQEAGLFLLIEDTGGAEC